MPRKRNAARAPQGDCYEAAVNFVRSECGTRDPDGCPFMIVQAEVRGQGPLAGKTFGHAWALDPESELVYDYSNGRRLVLPQAIYYAVGGVDELNNIHAYTWREAQIQMLRTRHYGPWELVTRSGLGQRRASSCALSGIVAPMPPKRRAQPAFLINAPAGITRCSICDEPAHASETDDLDRHPACRDGADPRTQKFCRKVPAGLGATDDWASTWAWAQDVWGPDPTYSMNQFFRGVAMRRARDEGFEEVGSSDVWHLTIDGVRAARARGVATRAKLTGFIFDYYGYGNAGLGAARGVARRGASRPTAADFLPGTRVMFRHNGHDFVGRVMGDDNGSVLRVRVQEDNGPRWIVEAHQVKRLDGGHGGGFGATTMRPVSELLSEGFDAGNYAHAYESTDLDDVEDKLEGRAPAYAGGFVLGFYSSYAPHEINDDRYDDARRKYGRLARQHGFID